MDLWYPNDIVGLIKARFGVEYSERQVRRILKGFKMKHAKPYQVDYRKPGNANVYNVGLGLKRHFFSNTFIVFLKQVD